MTRPRFLIAVVGTNTEVGKTWVSQHLLSHARMHGSRVAARKPVQSFTAGERETDAEQLAAASGESVHAVCPEHRWYPVPMAPPMAADVLGRPRISMAELVAEIVWPAQVELGLVETVGGVRSPLAHDGDSIELVRQLSPDAVLLVADAGLGTINAVRLALQVTAPWPTCVFLNRYDAANELHRLNRQWLLRQDGIAARTGIEELPLRLDRESFSKPCG
jgi:dethiobiotin synthetase